MAEIKNIEMVSGGIELNVSISMEEYKILEHHLTDIAVFPCGRESLVYSLTTGKLGNSNRIMLPKKILESFKITTLEKKAPSNIFMLDGSAFLLVKIKESDFGIPKFWE
jgi:hypothetical protein